MTRFLLFIWIFLLISCSNFIGYRNDIPFNYERTERQLIPLIDTLRLQKVELTSKGLLILNDTFVTFNTDTTNDPQMWVRDTKSSIEWVKKHGQDISQLLRLKLELDSTNNYRIIKDFDSYFCSEGGWIDSNFGKAFRINDDKPIELKVYKFDRVKSMKRLDKYKHWYDYYAD